MTNGKRNRRAGHQLERDLVLIFRQIGFPNVVTARSESKSRDDQKIDLMNKDERVNGRLPYNIQAKNTTLHLKYAKLLEEIPVVPGVMNVLIHKQTQKIGNKFVPTGQYAILNLEDFLLLIQQRDEQRNVRGKLVQPVKKRNRTAVLSRAATTVKTGIQNSENLSKTE